MENNHFPASLDYEDLPPVTIPVNYRGKKYILHQADEGMACTFRNAQARAARMTDGKVTGVDGIADVEPLLVSLCLKEVYKDDGSTRAVPVSTIKSWDPKVVSDLFDWAKKISHLDGKDTVESIDAQIEKLQKQREKLIALDPTTDSPNNTEHTLSSLPN